MDSFIVRTAPDLLEPGNARSLSGVLNETSFVIGGEVFETPQGITYNVQLANTGDGIVLTGTASCHAITSCARCLEPVELDLDGEVEGYYLLEPAEELDGYERDEFECVNEDGSFDIAAPIQAALVYAAPYQALCKADCAGLCQSCGANLNEGPCDCDDGDIDDSNPFAALKDFKFE